MRKVLEGCYATIGILSLSELKNVNLGKAGRKRWMGIRPTVRGSVMNPIDHPHGGGEGRAPIGRDAPVSPWGWKTLGRKTRNPRKASTRLIVRRRKNRRARAIPLFLTRSLLTSSGRNVLQHGSFTQWHVH